MKKKLIKMKIENLHFKLELEMLVSKLQNVEVLTVTSNLQGQHAVNCPSLSSKVRFSNARSIT